MELSQQLERENFAVSAKYVGINHPDAINGWISNELSYGDYSAMAVHTHKLESGRRIATPAWAINTDQLAAVACRFMEMRAGFRCPRTGTIKRRIMRAERRIRDVQLPRYRKDLATLCQRFVAARTAEEKHALEILIANRDSYILTAERGAKLVTAVIHYWYNLGWDSVQTGRAVGITPPCVRQLVYRLRKCAAEVERGIVAKPWRRERAERAVKLRELGLPWREVARRVGFGSFDGLRRILILEGLYKPVRPGWDGRTFAISNFEEARALRAEGLSYSKIASRLGYNSSAVAWNACNRKVSLVPARERHHGRQINAEQVAELRAEGKTFTEISVQLGCLPGGAFQALRRWRERQQRAVADCSLTSEKI